MGRSNTRSHSSRSKSRSQSSSRSRSRSHSKKKRYSSRSRSRTYSRSRSRDRVYNRDNRDYRRDYRNNRGMRRPFIYRGRGRGYYQGGARYFRGGYRPMWNRRHSRSPRRGRSHSRSPKRRSVSSQRSRSRSHRSYRSSRSPRTSSSRSSSPYRKSPIPSKKRGSLEKQTKKTEGAASHHSPLNSKSQHEQKDAFERDPSESLDELNKATVRGDSWTGLSTYDNSPRSPLSPSVASPSSLSSSRSDAPLPSTLHSGKNSSPRSHSRQHSPERSDSGSLENGSARYSPSQNSPLHHIPSRRSPTKIIPSQSAPREESRIRSSFSSAGDQEAAKAGKFLKRYTDEESRVHPLDRGNTREKETQKERGEKNRKEGEGEWEADEAVGYLGDKDANKQPFLSVSEGEDLEETEDYRQFRKSVLADQGKHFASASHWHTEEEGAKYKSKISRKGSRESDRFKEDKPYKVRDTNYVVEKPSTTKDKHKQEDKISERIMVKKEIQSTDQVKSEKLKELFNYSPPLHKSLESREKSAFREESPLRIRMIATESQRPEVKLKMTAVPLDDTIGPTLTNDRLLASTLVHSVKKEQEFRSIFDHIKVPHASKSSSESFIQHIVSLVHQVKEHYFKSAVGMTLNQRFTGYQQATKEPSTRQKSPEIHRRIDVSPSALRKHTRLSEERPIIEETQKQADKKLRVDSADLRHDIDRRRKERSKERGDSKGSRESSGSRKRDKHQKNYKEYKSYKEESKRKREQDRSRSTSSSSSSSREEKDSKKDDDFKAHHEQKEYAGFTGIGRPRGTFQFRIRGRGRARGGFAGTNTGPSNSNTTFQKRPKEEEWDPEYTPKSKKYFLHDDRDDGVDYWAKRGRGRGTFQRGRGRFTFKKSGSSPKWTHDKYQGDGLLEDEDEAMENNEERKERRKEAKE